MNDNDDFVSYDDAAKRLGLLVEQQAEERQADGESAEDYQRAREDRPAIEWAPSSYGAGDVFDPRPEGLETSNEDPADTGRPRTRGRARQAGTDALRAFTADVGTSWTTVRTTNPDLPESCRFCGDRLLSPNEQFPCEFDGAEPAPAVTYRAQPGGMPVRYVEYGPEPQRPLRRRAIVREEIPLAGAVPGRNDSGKACRCNGCRQRHDGIRKRGGQPRQCGKPECKSALRKEQNRRKRDRENARQRELAAEWIRWDPSVPDADIASHLDILTIRVREARQQLTESEYLNARV